MPVMMTTTSKRRNSLSRGVGPTADPCDTIRVSKSTVKVKDARRKQQWVDPMPLTPPRSPLNDDHSNGGDCEIMDDLWELWTGSGLVDDDFPQVKQEYTYDSALSDLVSLEEERHSSCGTYRRVSIGDIDAEGLFNNISPCDDSDLMTDGEHEELLNHLFQFVPDDSPPPTNPPSPPAPGDMDMDIDNSSYGDIVINGIKRESIDSEEITIQQDSTSSENRLNGDSDYSSSTPDDTEAFLSDSNSGTEDGSGSLYDEGFIGEDLINAQPDLFFDDNQFNSLLDQHITSNIFEEDFGRDLKSDCMWHPMDYDLRGHQHSKIEKSENQKTKIKIEPSDPEEVNLKLVKAEPNRLREEMDEDDAMCWRNVVGDPYQMWSEVTPPPSECPSASPGDCVDETESFKGLDWREAIDDSREQYELEMRRNATMNDHSYANPSLEPKSSGRQDPPRKGIQGMLGVHHAAFTSSLKSVSSYCVPQTSLFNRSPNSSSSRGTGTPSMCPTSSPSSTTSTHSRHKKSKTNRSIMREGGTITFPNQQSPASPLASPPSGVSSNLTASGRPKKTKTHNNMERMRRIDLRNSFDSLKKLVPPLAKSSKTSKVEILRRAEEYIRALKSLEKRLLREEATVRSKNEALKLKLLHSQQ